MSDDAANIREPWRRERAATQLRMHMIGRRWSWVILGVALLLGFLFSPNVFNLGKGGLPGLLFVSGIGGIITSMTKIGYYRRQLRWYDSGVCPLCGVGRGGKGVESVVALVCCPECGKEQPSAEECAACRYAMEGLPGGKEERRECVDCENCRGVYEKQAGQGAAYG